MMTTTAIPTATTATEADVATPRWQGIRYRLSFRYNCRKCHAKPLQMEYRDGRLCYSTCPTCGDDIHFPTKTPTDRLQTRLAATKGLALTPK